MASLKRQNLTILNRVKNMYINIINHIKKQKGITNERISEISGVKKSTVDKIMSGSQTNPTINTLEKICNAVDCGIYIIDNETGELDLRKFQFLDDYGKKAVMSILDIEFQRCSGCLSENITEKAVARSDGGGEKFKDLPPDSENIENIDDL